MRRPLVVIALSLLIVASPLAGVGSPEPPAPAAPRLSITLDVDYSRKPLLTIDARGIGADELMGSLARELGFDVRRLGARDRDLLVRGRFVGRLEDLLPWLLSQEDYLVVYGEPDADGRRAVATVLLLNSRRGAPPAPALAPRAGRLEEIRQYVASRPDVNRDLRAALEQSLARAGAGDANPDMSINLYDAPSGVTDMLERVNETLAPDFAVKRLENRGPGTPPRYLTGANDAAQQDVAAALARTTSMARHNLKALTDALGQACADATCAGIAPSEIRERERRLREEGQRPKPGP